MKLRLYTLALLFATLQTFAQTYTYDDDNRLYKVTYDNGITITYEYDELGNRISQEVKGSTAAKFTITTSVTPSGSGSVTGGGTYGSGTTIELKAHAKAGYKFSKWSNGKTDNPLTINVTENANYIAEFVVSSSEIVGDIVPDGTINNQDLNGLVDAYTSGTAVTKVTDIDTDNQLTITDITRLISMLPQEGGGSDDDTPTTYNGHEYVDLGLPSGTLWATCNVGASTPEEAGCYYAWGETTGSCEGKTNFYYGNYKYYNDDYTKYNDTDNLSILEASDDAATVNWGGNWCTPTRTQFTELSKNASWEWTEQNGVKGWVITSNIDGYTDKKIFIPAAGYYRSKSFEDFGEYGYYWTSNVYATEYGRNYYLRPTAKGSSQQSRGAGLSVRPVVSKNAINN